MEHKKETDESDLLFAMYWWQEELMNLVVPTEMKLTRLAELSVACALTEAAEANVYFLNETKPWKPTEPDWAKVDEEMIDVLHFVLQYFISRRIRPFDLYGMYKSKNLTNQQRVKDKLQLDGGSH